MWEFYCIMHFIPYLCIKSYKKQLIRYRMSLRFISLHLCAVMFVTLQGLFELLYKVSGQ